MPPLRILCTGDLHLGRHPSRVPAAADELSVRTVWQRFVDHAIRQRVDAVALTGDLIDRENRFFEAFGPLQEGLQRLRGAAIEVFAVTGNHDYDLLSSVSAFEHEGAHLLGAGGTWTSAPLMKEGVPVAHITGWSFPTQHVHESPLDTYKRPASDLPVVGLLHGDLDQPASSYAPVRSADLASTGAAAWLLGHIHRPQVVELSGTPALYPGSLQPLDPGEPGVHGAWLVEVPATGPATFTQVPLATLRYETLEVNLTEVSDQETFIRSVTAALESHLEVAAEAMPSMTHAACRLRFTGRTSMHRHVDAFAERLIDEFTVPLEGAEATVEGYLLDTKPVYDLEALATRTDPPGVLAHVILDLMQGPSTQSHEQLVSALATDLDDFARSNKYQPLRRAADTIDRPDAAQAQQLLIRQGMLLLDELMAQKS